MKSQAAKIMIYTLVVLLSLGVLWMSISFSMENKAIYQGF